MHHQSGQLTVDWIDYHIIRKLGYYCHNSLPISNLLQSRKRQSKHDQDLITWPAHIHLVYLIKSDVKRNPGREESGYQFHDMKIISIDTPWVVRGYRAATWLDTINHDQAVYCCSRAWLQHLCTNKTPQPSVYQVLPSRTCPKQENNFSPAQWKNVKSWKRQILIIPSNTWRGDFPVSRFSSGMSSDSEHMENVCWFALLTRLNWDVPPLCSACMMKASMWTVVL